MTFKTRSHQSGFTLIEIIATVVVVAVFSAMMLTMFSDSLIKSSDPMRRILKSSDLSKVMANIMADYSPYPRWKASTSYSAGNKVLPTGMNGRFYICTTTSGNNESSTSEPQWRDYGDTQDGNVTWKAGAWVKQTSYATGNIVVPTNPNGHFYRCITAGMSGTAEPTWPLTGYATISDGAVTWKRLLGYIYEEVLKPDTPAAPNLSSKKNSLYGQYYVVENRFVIFDTARVMQTIGSGDPENVLEIKISSVEKNPDGTESPGSSLTVLFTAKEN